MSGDTASPHQPDYRLFVAGVAKARPRCSGSPPREAGSNTGRCGARDAAISIKCRLYPSQRNPIPSIGSTALWPRLDESTVRRYSWVAKNCQSKRGGTSRPKRSGAKPRSFPTAKSAKSCCAKRASYKPHPISTSGCRRPVCPGQRSAPERQARPTTSGSHRAPNFGHSRRGIRTLSNKGGPGRLIVSRRETSSACRHRSRPCTAFGKSGPFGAGPKKIPVPRVAPGRGVEAEVSVSRITPPKEAAKRKLAADQVGHNHRFNPSTVWNGCAAGGLSGCADTCLSAARTPLKVLRPQPYPGWGRFFSVAEKK
jgi:hypothetical protein